MKTLYILFACIFVLNGQLAYASVQQYDSIKILVRDHAITENEIEIRSFELARARLGSQAAAMNALSDFREEAVKQLIEESLLDVRADELMITISDQELDDEIDRFQQQRNLSQLEFEELLERQKISVSDFRKTYRRQLRRNKLIVREIRSKIGIDENALKKAYEDRQGLDLLVHARHILLMVNQNAPQSKVDAIRKKAIDLRKRILDGDSFAKIADQYSEDPSVKTNHGDLGFFKKGDMVREFSEAAFKLNPGEISEPVRTKFGFHLIEVLETKSETKEPFESVKNKLMNQEYQDRFQKQYTQYISSLKSSISITYK